MKVIKNSYYILVCVFLAWLFVSWLEIINKAILGGATYNDYNIIVNTINHLVKINGGIF